MAEADVVISAFAVPPRSSDRAIAMPLDLFTEEPKVVGVDPDYSKGATSDAGAFAQAAENYRDGSGHILPRLLRSRLTGVTVRRICLVGFSAGVTFVSKVLASADAANVDTVLVLDGMHIQRVPDGSFFSGSYGPWVNFGVRAARGVTDLQGVVGPMMLISHTAIRQGLDREKLGLDREKLVGNTDESAAAVFDMVKANSPDALRLGYDPTLLGAGPPPPPVTITVNRPIAPGQSVPITRTWDVMPQPAIRSRGNFWVLDYGGAGEPDHVFQARHVQGALWRTFLAPRWNAGMDCV